MKILFQVFVFVEVLTTQLHIYKYVWCARALILQSRGSEFWILMHSHQGWWFSSPVWKAQQRCYYGNSVLTGSKANIWKCDLLWERWFALGISCKCFWECFEFEMWFKWFTPTGMICSGNTHGWIPSVLNLHNRENHKHCQRHNGPEGWVHITNSNRHLDQISSWESWPSINFKISTKHQPLHKT